MTKKILIVEDDTFTGESLKAFFKEKGFDVDFVSNGQTAVNFIIKNNYSLVITDLMMPVMDGLYLLNRIKDISDDLPVIIITAYDNMENVLTAYQFGAIELLNKPFELSELENLVDEIL